MVAQLVVTIIIGLFPSPCGVLVLKFAESRTSSSSVQRKFPSPCGVLVLKFEHKISLEMHGFGFRPLAGFWFLNYVIAYDIADFTAWFPSPCGVLVLKLIMKVQVSFRQVKSFRPLAGFWFLNFAGAARCRRPSNRFRPLAGFWFLNFWTRLCGYLPDRHEFPSPCGVLVLKL